VVGASLTQNDWNVLSLIFNSQRHREITHGAPFLIELIMPLKDAEAIIMNCGYLKRVTSISRLTQGDFSGYSDPEKWSSDMENPFQYWLTQKMGFHRAKNEFQDADRAGEISRAIGG
jgi:hypothetical protein